MGYFIQTVTDAAGVIGSCFSELFGAWSAGMTTLALFLAADFFAGRVVALVFKKPRKSGTGEAAASLKALLRKLAKLLLVIVARRLDLLIGASYCRDATVIALCLGETVSIIENVALMGVPIPEPIRKSIARLRKTDGQ